MLKNEKKISKADPLVDKILYCPRIKISITQSLFLDGVETRNALPDFEHQLRRKSADVPDVSNTLIDAVGIAFTLVIDQNARTEEREKTGSHSRPECQKVQRLCAQVAAAFGSVRNLVNACNLLVSKVRHSLQSNVSCTKSTVVTSKIKKTCIIQNQKLAFGVGIRL